MLQRRSPHIQYLKPRMIGIGLIWLLCLLSNISGSLARDDYAFSRAQAEIRQAQQKNITGLSLFNMGLTTLPPELGELTQLSHLDLSSNQLQTLPDVVFTLPNLTKLTVTGNELLELSPQIAQLTQLQELDLSNNSLTELPAEIGMLQNLRQLSVLDNQLTTLPPEIGQLDALHVLNVGNNQITHLPPEIGDMDSLGGLWVADNQLNALPHEIGAIDSLSWLNMERNPNRGLPEHVFRSRTNIDRYHYPDNEALLAYYQMQWQAARTAQDSLLLLLGVVFAGFAVLFAFMKLPKYLSHGKRKRKR